MEDSFLHQTEQILLLLENLQLMDIPEPVKRNKLDLDSAFRALNAVYKNTQDHMLHVSRNDYIEALQEIVQDDEMVGREDDRTMVMRRILQNIEQGVWMAPDEGMDTEPPAEATTEGDMENE